MQLEELEEVHDDVQLLQEAFLKAMAGFLESFQVANEKDIEKRISKLIDVDGVDGAFLDVEAHEVEVRVGFKERGAARGVASRGSSAILDENPGLVHCLGQVEQGDVDDGDELVGVGAVSQEDFEGWSAE